MKKDYDLRNQNPETETVRVFSQQAIRLGIEPKNLAGFVSDLANMLDSTNERERMAWLQSVTTDMQLNTERMQKIAISCIIHDFSPIHATKILLTYEKSAVELPKELQPAALNPVLLRNIAKHLRGVV